MTPIQTASRNALTIRWLGRQSPVLVALMREHYSDYLGIPIEQTNSAFTSNEELAWVFAQFGSEIQELSKS